MVNAGAFTLALFVIFRTTLQSFQVPLPFTSKTAFRNGAEQERNHFGKQMQGRHFKV